MHVSGIAMPHFIFTLMYCNKNVEVLTFVNVQKVVSIRMLIILGFRCVMM